MKTTSTFFKALFAFLSCFAIANDCLPQTTSFDATASLDLEKFEAPFVGLKPAIGLSSNLAFLSEAKRFTQQKINERYASEFVLTYNTINDEAIFDDNNYNLPIEERTIDNEQITPYNWKWVSVEMDEPFGGKFKAHLRRPNWWLLKNNATQIGDLVYLSLPEMAIEGMVTVTGLEPSFIDTRVPTFDALDGYTYRPITGWTERTAGDVWNFIFSTGDTISATASHPFFSVDRQAYRPIGEFAIGERVKVKEVQAATLMAKCRREALTERVYNLEVWRDHNYQVGVNGILVHNSYIDDVLEVINKFIAGKYKATGTAIDAVIAKLASFPPSLREAFVIDFGETIGGLNEYMVDAWKVFKREGVNNLDRINNGYLSSISLAIERGAMDVPFVKSQFQSFTQLSESIIEHILRGNGGPTGGVHHISAFVERTDIKFRQIEKKLSNGCYKAKVQFPNGQYPPKTFFPDDWDEVKVVQEIKNVFESPNTVPFPVEHPNAWKGFSSEGVEMIIIKDGNSIATAYPIVN